MVTKKKFKKIILAHFDAAKREFPWRETTDPYKILVSEIMLQQTQAPRVVSKYNDFIRKFPTVKRLAKAKVSDVLGLWIGLGYNRRALSLLRLAQIVASDYRGVIPDTFEELVGLPGIGPYTAGAILAFAFNKPHPVIETNIRTVYIHFFFTDGKKIDDKELLPLITSTLDRVNPREWYWALMDYGTFLKGAGKDKGRVSKQYVRQSTFKGSDREVRGKILKLLHQEGKLSGVALERMVQDGKRRVVVKLLELEQEGFVTRKGSMYELKK
jgi:A/G-specific adenine glycosylase